MYVYTVASASRFVIGRDTIGIAHHRYVISLLTRRTVTKHRLHMYNVSLKTWFSDPTTFLHPPYRQRHFINGRKCVPSNYGIKLYILGNGSAVDEVAWKWILQKSLQSCWTVLTLRHSPVGRALTLWSPVATSYAHRFNIQKSHVLPTEVHLSVSYKSEQTATLATHRMNWLVSRSVSKVAKSGYYLRRSVRPLSTWNS